jgi:hypothetical protein
MKDMIAVSQQQKEFILKAIWNISILYDFDNTTEKEFKETYKISKGDLKVITNELSEELRKNE